MSLFKLESVTPSGCSPLIDTVLFKKIMNDYMFSNSYIDICFLSTCDESKSYNVNEVLGYCYRRLWETTCLRHHRKSYMICQDNCISFHYVIDVAEALQILDICVPPVLKKNKRAVDLVDNISGICGLLQNLFTDPITASTNISYLNDVCRIKPYDWRPSYSQQRLAVIRTVAYEKKNIAPVLIADSIASNLLSDDDEKQGIVSFTCRLDNRNAVEGLLQCIGDVEVTDILFDKETSDLSVTCYIEGGLTPIQVDSIRETMNAIK